MVACVHDPIDGWGGGQAPMHQMKSACCTPPSPRTRRPKEVSVRARPSRGVGGRRIINPRPRQVKSCHVTTPLSPACSAALQNILTRQSKHMYMYLLTKLSASQPATRHVCFRTHHTVYIHHRHNFQGEARGATAEERKEPPARGTPHTEDRLVRSRKVYS
jgi:hypothetical protein